MSIVPRLARIVRRGMVDGHLVRQAAFTIGGRSIVYAPIRRQSRLLDQLVDQGIWSYEPELSHFIFANPFGYERFVDGGAHVALFSTFAECSGKYRSITAIEASPATAAYIRAFKERNDLHFALHECALGEGEGRLTFEIPDTGYLMPSHSALSVSELYREQKKRKIEVASRPLTDFLEAGHTLVKLDCEGAEETILKAALGVLRDRGDIDLIIEIMINDANGQDVFALMRDAGFDAYLMTNAGLVREDRPLTLPVQGAIPKKGASRTGWRNHLFTKKPVGQVQAVSRNLYGYFP
jgi:FkbM family methyltransferase